MWARRERRILDTLHRTHPPTHQATVKFLRPVDVETIRVFDRRVRQSITNWSKRHGQEFAVCVVREIEWTNCIHYHFLIRTAECDPWDVLPTIIDKASNEAAMLRYCKPVENVHRCTRYAVKDLKDVQSGVRPIFLFKPGVGLHLLGSWNGYFVKSRRELWEAWKLLHYGSAAKPCRGSP
ncbi:MAG: hypothetical protein L0241_28215 [Planctomycetia bacterium]|nr:hypothetical protein [Planctomycetia bacterium]